MSIRKESTKKRDIVVVVEVEVEAEVLQKKAHVEKREVKREDQKSIENQRGDIVRGLLQVTAENLHLQTLHPFHLNLLRVTELMYYKR